MKIIAKLEMGASFSEGILGLIDNQAYQQVCLAEKHGQLSQVLGELAGFERLRTKQIQKIKAMLIYPLFLCVLLVTLVIFIHVLIFPQIESLMPMVRSKSVNWFNSPWMVGGGTALVVLSLLAVGYFMKQSAIKKAVILARVPIIGPIFRKYMAYYLASNLAILLRNGLSVKEIYQTLVSANQASLLFMLGQKLNTALVQGDSLLRVVKRHPFIPQEIVKFLNSGQTIPEMANTMTAYAKLTFDDIISMSNKLIGVIQPAMFLVIGATIVTTYFQLLIPIYESVKGMY